MSTEKFKKSVWISFMILLIVSLFSVESFVSNAMANDGSSECSLAVFEGYWECTFNGYSQVNGDVYPVIAIGEFISDGEENFDGVGPRTVLVGPLDFLQNIECTLSPPSQSPVCSGIADCDIEDPFLNEHFNYALISPNKTIFSSIEPPNLVVSGTCERIMKEDDDDDDDDDDD